VNNEPADVPVTPPAPPLIAAPPPLVPAAPPVPAPKPSAGKKFLAGLLSVFLGLIVVNAAVSVLDDSCAIWLDTHLLTGLSGIILCLTVVAAAAVYGLMGLMPMIPKRIFLPAVLVVIGPFFFVLPVMIYFFRHLMLLDWFLSWAELALGLLILRWLAGTWKFRWPLVAERHLRDRRFRWGNLLGFVLLNVLVFLPVVAVYVAVCTSLAVSHFTDGFMALRPGGIILQARKYVRNDGRTVILFPMSHIAESDFYRGVARTVTSNSVVLLEGVTDTQNLITNKLTYERAAKKLHLADQHDDFDLKQGTLVRADVDVRDFSSNTIAVLNMVALFHSQGLNARTLSLLLQTSSLDDAQQRQLFDDLLLKRNQHVLNEFFTRLPSSDNFVIPWGAAHMVGLAEEIQKAGFHLVGTRDYVSIRFGAKKGKADEGDAAWIPPKGASRP
jgi:hypothetical protein